ncbi:MAG: DUF1800 domain-containing protein [Casimicrobiaceae bacterium]
MARRAERAAAGASPAGRPTWRALQCGAFLAWLALVAPASAAPTDVLSYDDARHLLTRSGFAPTDAEVQAYAGLAREAAVARLLATAGTAAVTPLPEALTAPGPLRPPGGPDASPEARKAFVRVQVQDGLMLRSWWLQEMLVTPSPLTERMTLFWHNHFVSAQPKVRVTRLMLAQNTTLRAHALGNFGSLLHALAKDPAMIVYLDGAQNRKGAPNENFAREVMELFTLGEGHYTETDVKEAARAFTGWSLDRETGVFIVRPLLHDPGVKTIFGRTGRFDGDDVLDLLLARPETASFVTTKLWREFVSPDPDQREVARIAGRFRASHYDIRVALRELLTSDAFYRADNRAVLVKSPVELVVGSLRQLAILPRDPLPFALAAAGMGQNLFSPPNVKGWPGGEVWINTNTLLARKQFLERLTRRDGSGNFASPAPAGMASAAVPSPDAETSAVAAMSAPPAMAGPAESVVVAPRVARAGTRMNAPSSEPPAIPGMSAAPRAVLAASSPGDAGSVRRERFARAMERGLDGVQFDSARWMARLGGTTVSERHAAAVRLLLPVAPQQPLDLAAEPLTLVRAAMLDVAYQLK